MLFIKLMPRINVTMGMITMFSKVKLLRHNICAQVYTTGKYTMVQPMKYKTGDSIRNSLWELCNGVGIPAELIADLASAQEGAKTKFMALVKKMRIIVHWSEKGRHLQNHKVDGEISLLKQRWYNIMDQRRVPKRLWDFGLVWCAEVLSMTAQGPDGRTGHEQVTGETPDISDWLDFSFFDLVHYWKNDTMLDMTDDKKKFGYWIGVSHQVRKRLTYWILTASGKIIANGSVQHVLREILIQPEMKTRFEESDKNVRTRLDDKNFFVNHQ